MGCKKAGLAAVLLLLALEGLFATGPSRVHLAPGVETPPKTLSTDYYCDFDNADHPFCDWSQPPNSQGSLWLRAQGQKPGESPGPPEGDIARRDNYIHPAAGGLAQLESPDVDLAGAEVCVRFLYYFYGLSSEVPLSVEIQDASGSVALLWTPKKVQSTSWLSGAITVPAQTLRPFKVVFKGKEVSTGDISLALDSIFIQPGPCSPCKTKCDFDTAMDLCGWSNPDEGDVAWTQWPGSTGIPGVGPSDDFSRPGAGSYMWLEPFDEGSRGSSFLKSPTFSSGGCLLLTFFYTLHGVSDDSALKIYAAPPGGDLGVPLLTLKGEHGPNWRGRSVNYTGREDIQFVFEGIYAGNPGLAVDNVAVSPCEDIFASCDFNNNTDPFCGWSESMNNTWKRTNRNTPTEDTGPPGDYPHGEGYYIYVEGGQLKPNESTRFSSSPFCISQEACVEFYYHMHSVVEVETQLQVLLEDPSGSAVLLWNRIGTQSPNWLYGSVTLPYTRAQPSKVTFEVIRGRNAYLDVSLDNILVHKGLCAEYPPTPVPPSTIATAPTTAVGPVPTVPHEQSTISRPTMITSSKPTMPSASTDTKSTGTKPHPTALKSTVDTGESIKPITVTTSAPVVTRNTSLATTPVPPITTTEAVLTNITIPTGTAATPITTSTAVGPNITVPTGTAATPITTTEAVHPNITVPTGTATTPITTSTTVSPNITVPTGTAGTPITTSTAVSPNIPIPTGTAATPIITSTAVHPNITVPTTTASTPITTSTAVGPNITVPTGTATTPITTSTAVGPNITNPIGTAATPITSSTAVHPNITVPTTTASTPITTSTAVGPNITVPTEIATTPITISTAVGSNITIPTGTATTPITTSTTVGPNITIPFGTAATPITSSTAVGPNITIPIGTASTPITTSTAVGPNITVPTETATTPITTSTTVGPNITIPTGTAATPITTSTAVGPHITIPIGTAATPITSSTAVHPNITVPTTTASTPITTSTAVGPNITVPTETATTPITTSTTVGPNITIPTGTAATPITTSTAVGPNITIPIGTAATPITSSTAVGPNSTIPIGTASTPITTSTTVGPNITIPTGTAATPITTSTAVGPNITIPIGTAATPITSSTAVGPNSTIPIGTASTPITTSTAVSPNITVPTGTATTPITTSTTVGPNITIPTGTATTPITTSTAVGPNITIPTGTATTPITTSTAVGPNITIPTGTATTPITTSTAVGPNITIPTGTATTPITSSTAVHPNITVPTTTASTPITTSTAVGPNITIPTGTATTPITTSTVVGPNITVPTGTAATPITTSTAVGPNITIPTGTAATPITTSTAVGPNITVPTGTAATPITTSTAIRPNITVPTTTADTPITTSTSVGPNIIVSTTTAGSPITTSTSVGPNITVPTTTADTPITTSTSVGPNIIVSTTTASSPITTSTAVRPNITIPTTTASTPITSSVAVHPNTTILTGTTSTPKLTTTLQPPTYDTRPNKPSSPTSALTSSTPSKSPTTMQPLLTDSVNTPKSTTKRPGVDQTTPGQPPVSASCIVSGDPHYTTYDGRLFHFMGNCTYLLTATCNATPDQPTFQIQTTNEHRGSNTKVSYLKSVNITMQGTEIVLLKGRRVTVDGKRVTLPVSLDGGRVSVHLSGTFVRVQTNFGLSVRFDGNHHAEVSVPSSYFGKLCGLCGNFNGQTGDDNLMADGTSAGADANQLGKSWQVPSIGDASCTDSKDPEKCHPDIAGEGQGPTGCGILTDPQGPFAPCHGKVPPEGAFENCFYDLCETDGDAGMLCFALQAYADRCAQAGVPIAWRNSTFCPLNCPPGSSYTTCGPACPATCSDPGAQNRCPALPCVEGCVCDQGSVLSGDQCVPLSQCGCTDADGHYHVVGDSWMGNPTCTQRCSCAAGNQITCEEWSCTPVQECRPAEGLLGCQDTGVSTCHVAGDPHYYTFDGKMVSFMGTCTYSLVALCQHDPRLPSFNITAKNEERGQPEASYLRHVTVHVQGVTITLQKSRRVLIDGKRVRVPAEDRIPGVSIVPRGIYVVIETNFGLVVKFDGNHHLEIQLPGTYFGKVCGMCGNFNNQTADDYLMLDGHLAANDSQFGNSWKAPGDSDVGCQPDDRPDLKPSCSAQDLERLSALCLEIMAPKYQACHALVNPELFFHNCLYDLCQYQGLASVLCDNIQAYVEACKSHGVTGVSWRNSTFCPLPCPPHSHFSECASPCPATCSNLYAPASCQYPAPCVEGCACDRGYVLSDLACVPMRECGCRDPQQEYHNSGDTWVTSGCQQRCRCLSGQIECQTFGCPTGSQCSTSNQGLHYCRPTGSHQCVISGDPHYRTFDNFVHHFQGRCTYTLTQTMGRLPDGLERLSVDGRNHRRSIFHRFSFLREVYVEVLGFRVTLMQGRKMAVNGVRVTPPYSPTEGLQITQRGRRLIVETNFGFSVSYDGHNSAEIVLPNTYKERVGGLCGNYDGRRNNEYIKPDGTRARTLNAFGNSWQVSVKSKELDRGSGTLGPARVRRQEPEEEEPESGFEIDCSLEQLAVVNGSRACGALLDPSGPFSACHALVSPAPFQKSCVYDLCALFNDTELLCQDLEAYAQLCQEQEVALGPWRETIGCEMECPAHTSYQPCMTACPTSCANLAAQSSCEAPCVEGCASDPGYVLSGLVSVPYGQCGCSINGRYYQINQTFMTEDCSERCLCQATGALECLPAGCGPGEICTVSDYVRGCFQDNACVSRPCQNEGECQVTPEGFKCVCVEGYIGPLCEDSPLESSTPAPPKTSTSSASSTTRALPEVSQTTDAGKPQGPNLLTILLGVFIPLAAILLLTLIILCVCRHRNHGYKMKLDEDRVSIISTTGFPGL